MRPALQDWLKEETTALSDRRIPYHLRMRRWKRLVQTQEGVVQIQRDGSTDADYAKDAVEYLERLRRIAVPL